MTGVILLTLLLSTQPGLADDAASPELCPPEPATAIGGTLPADPWASPAAPDRGFGYAVSRGSAGRFELAQQDQCDWRIYCSQPCQYECLDCCVTGYETCANLGWPAKCCFQAMRACMSRCQGIGDCWP